MHGRDKSDSSIVAGKPTHKAGRSAAGPVEPRAEAKGNAGQQSTHRAQYRERVAKALACIRQHIAAVDTRGGSRMRESCTYGSERGARGNSRPYRDRREFISFLGGAAAWPLAARAQQSAMPVIGFLDSRSPDTIADRLRAFRLGLKDTGYVEGENVTIVHRFAEDQVDRLPELAAELVRRQVAVMIATGVGAFVAKTATATIPIVFVAAEDPVRLGLVANIARPGGNLTGINLFNSELVAQRLDLLRELVPRAARIAVLVNPASGEYRDYREGRDSGCSCHWAANPGRQR